MRGGQGGKFRGWSSHHAFLKSQGFCSWSTLLESLLAFAGHGRQPTFGALAVAIVGVVGRVELLKMRVVLVVRP